MTLASAAALAAARPAMRQLTLDLGPDTVPGLDDFVPGLNAEVLDWLQAWPAVSGPLSPAYIWGPAGSGKTHLMRAMVERALGLGFGVIWLNGQTCQMWDAAMPGAPTLALIDECERLDAEAQHLAFKLFIESAAAAAARAAAPRDDAPLTDAAQEADADDAPAPLFILAAGSMPSVDLPVRDDLRTRLGWGLGFSLHPLDEAGLRHALQREASRRGMALGDDVIAYLLTRHDRDLGSLMQLLDRLDRFALAAHRVVTVPLLKQMLATESA